MDTKVAHATTSAAGLAIPPSDWNNILLTGRLVADPTTGFADELPMMQTAFTVECRELLGPGEMALTQIPCLAFGRAAAMAGGLQAGEHVLLAGQLLQGPGGLCVVIRSISPTGVAMPVAG
jgi:hypothetical protein